MDSPRGWSTRCFHALRTLAATAPPCSSSSNTSPARWPWLTLSSAQKGTITYDGPPSQLDEQASYRIPRRRLIQPSRKLISRTYLSARSIHARVQPDS